MSDKRKKRDVPVTGILAGIVLLLAAILMGILIFSSHVMREQSDGGTAKDAKRETLSEGRMETETEAIETETIKAENLEVESGDESAPAEAGTEAGEQSEVILIGAETEADTLERAGESEADSKAADEGASERETERETEIETETETETEPERLVVAVDPGHQGSWVDMSDTEPNGPGSSEMKMKSTTGTQGSYSGLAEYELNLEVSLLLRTELEARGYEVIMTREDHDTAISNAERAAMAYEEGGDIYVRIHANGSEDSSVNGALAMVPSESNPYVGALARDSYLLADCILSAYCAKAGFDSLGIQYYDNMTGINWSRIPVMILEMGFMTNESDDLRMADSSVQQLMAEGIADGIDAYFAAKGMTTALPQEQTEAETVPVFADTAQERVHAVMEALGEGYLYPQMDQGEDWAVSIQLLNTDAAGDLNGDVQMKSASVIKVFIMAAVYDRILEPSTEERRISVTESYEGELRQLLSDMITVSDNTAANTLLSWLGGGDSAAGMEVVNQFCEEHGYSETSVGRLFLEENPSGDNVTTANDCRALLADIYHGTCVSAAASAEMYEYLRQQTRTGKIPAGLTDTLAETANKTGELAGEYGDYVENDIAIVDNGEFAYVLCILSQNLNDTGYAVTQIRGMSEMIYGFFRDSVIG